MVCRRIQSRRRRATKLDDDDRQHGQCPHLVCGLNREFPDRDLPEIRDGVRVGRFPEGEDHDIDELAAVPFQHHRFRRGRGVASYRIHGRLRPDRRRDVKPRTQPPIGLFEDGHHPNRRRNESVVAFHLHVRQRNGIQHRSENGARSDHDSNHASVRS